jgi:hypothetical protein
MNATDHRTATSRRAARRWAGPALAVAALALSSQAAAAIGTWCKERCDQIVIDWNLQTHQVIKAADGYANPMAASRVLAMENADSRVRAGLHFRFATNAGLRLGERIGEYAIRNALSAH